MAHNEPTGEERLKAAIARLRKRREQPRPPISLEPTTPFEQAILHQYNELRRDYEDLKTRVDWLTIAIVGAALTFVLETIFTR